MKKTLYVCDKCGEEFSAEMDLDAIYIPYKFQPYGLVKKKMELCHKCQIKWAQFGKQFLTEGEENVN